MRFTIEDGRIIDNAAPAPYRIMAWPAQFKMTTRQLLAAVEQLNRFCTNGWSERECSGHADVSR